MDITIDDISRVATQILRLVNRYKKLDSQAMDFGTGEPLYPSEIHMIEAIGSGHGITVNEIGQKFGITKGAVSQVVNKLFDKGFVNKKRNPDFHKEIILTLTGNGRKAYEGHEKIHALMDADLYINLKNYRMEELISFEKILKEVMDHIEKFIELGEKG